MRHCRKLNRNQNKTNLINFNLNINIHFCHRIIYNFSSTVVPHSTTNNLQQYQHEKYFVIDPEYSDLFEEHGPMVIPHISNRTSTKISILRSDQGINRNVVLLRSDNNNNLQKCICQINEFLHQDMIEIRPSSLQPLMIPIMKYIRNQILPSQSNVDMFIDSYSSQMYIRGNYNDKQLAIECVHKLLSTQHLVIFQYLQECKNIISKNIIEDLCNKYQIFYADNYANPYGSKTIQYYLSCAQLSKMHFFFSELNRIAQVNSYIFEIYGN